MEMSSPALLVAFMPWQEEGWMLMWPAQETLSIDIVMFKILLLGAEGIVGPESDGRGGGVGGGCRDAAGGQG